MYYFLDKQDNSNATANFNCVYYRYNDTPDKSQKKKIAFHHHNHEAFELLAVTKGNLQVTVNQNKYLLNKGDIVIVNPFRIHYGEWIENGKENEYACITFGLNRWLSYRKSILFSEMNYLIDGKRCFDEFIKKESATEIFNIVELISSQFPKKDAANECISVSLIYSLLGELFKAHYNEETESDISSHNVKFMTQVSKYLSEHYAENISTTDVAKDFYMSVPSFCYIFKKNFGMSFLNYLCKYRITRAVELYYEKNIALSDLAEAVGFNDYCYFSRSFRKCMGKSPTAYFEK